MHLDTSTYLHSKVANCVVFIQFFKNDYVFVAVFYYPVRLIQLNLDIYWINIHDLVVNFGHFCYTLFCELLEPLFLLPSPIYLILFRILFYNLS